MNFDLSPEEEAYVNEPECFACQKGHEEDDPAVTELSIEIGPRTYLQMGICEECEGRPISELLIYVLGKETEADEHHTRADAADTRTL